MDPSPSSRPSGAAVRYAALYSTQIFAIGVTLPFLPPVLADQGLGPSEVAAVLAVGAAVRIVVGPIGGRMADTARDARRMLAVCSALAAVAVLGFGAAPGFAAMLLVSVLYSAAFGPVFPVTEALALGAARAKPGFDYGQVRGVGSIAFIAAAIGAGWVADVAGLTASLWLAAAGLAGAAVAALALPPPDHLHRRASGSLVAALQTPAFRWLLVVSALVQGSHALYYGFASIHWREAGLSPTVIGLLWAEGVVAEVAMFVWGRRLAERLGPVGLSLLAVAAGVLRWAVLAETTWLPALALVQPLHAATYAAQHLGAMQVLTRALPPGRAATVQAVHASIGVGLPLGVLTLASGPLYAGLGADGFWVMAAICAAAAPAALRLPR